MFIRVSFIDPLPVPAGLLIPATTALVHPNVAPAVLLAGLYVNGLPLHTGFGERLPVNKGIGLTRTTTFSELVHPFIVIVKT